MMNLGKMSSEKQGEVSGEFAVKNFDRNKSAQVGFTNMDFAKIAVMNKRV